MAEDSLQEYALSVFLERFGAVVLEATSQSLPHEMFVRVTVNQLTQEMQVLARALEGEFEELGRRVWVRVIEAQIKGES